MQLYFAALCGLVQRPSIRAIQAVVRTVRLRHDVFAARVVIASPTPTDVNMARSQMKQRDSDGQILCRPQHGHALNVGAWVPQSAGHTVLQGAYKLLRRARVVEQQMWNMSSSGKINAEDEAATEGSRQTDQPAIQEVHVRPAPRQRASPAHPPMPATGWLAGWLAAGCGTASALRPCWVHAALLLRPFKTDGSWQVGCHFVIQGSGVYDVAQVRRGSARVVKKRSCNHGLLSAPRDSSAKPEDNSNATPTGGQKAECSTGRGWHRRSDNLRYRHVTLGCWCLCFAGTAQLSSRCATQMVRLQPVRTERESHVLQAPKLMVARGLD